MAAPSLALIPWAAIRGPEGIGFDSIGAVCEGNTDIISARQISVGLIFGGGNNFLGRGARPTGTNLVTGLAYGFIEGWRPKQALSYTGTDQMA